MQHCTNRMVTTFTQKNIKKSRFYEKKLTLNTWMSTLKYNTERFIHRYHKNRTNFMDLLFSVVVFGWALAGLALSLALFSLMVALSTVFCLLKPDWWLLVWVAGTCGWGPVLKVSPKGRTKTKFKRVENKKK